MEKTEQLLGAASVPDSPKIGKKAANKIELRVFAPVIYSAGWRMGMANPQ
ncbi:hypothetical protein PCL1606_49410 [Pseudomonas chlororaphis]|uniref:Uncharacterized protein n=1 Tax=Pseudomonas chlororaphis TaxID=587753 RepID=A0A0D5Y4Z2_9PSED|nr:hypothetical protein PCL1606_49410 [Pseudomonas chlororaphis]